VFSLFIAYKYLIATREVKFKS